MAEWDIIDANGDVRCSNCGKELHFSSEGKSKEGNVTYIKIPNICPYCKADMWNED